jgi:hypothetical protein
MLRARPVLAALPLRRAIQAQQALPAAAPRRAIRAAQAMLAQVRLAPAAHARPRA